MHPDRQRELAGRLLDLHRAGTTQLAPAARRLPAATYTDGARFERERDVLFRRRPTVACLSADVAEPGDWVATESGGVPLLVARDADGELRCFVNVCRHRASVLVDDGCGRGAARFACGFHGWTYALDGRLVGQARSCGGFDELDRAELGLVARPVAERSGLVWVRAEGDEPVDLDAVLCGVDVELDEFGFGSYHRYGSWVSTWRTNWKLLVDTFLEPYHVPVLHRDSVARYYLAAPSLVDGFGPNLRYHSLQRDFVELADLPAEEWELASRSTIEYLLAPNTVLSHSVDHLAVYRFLPTAVDRTVVELVVHTPAPVDGDAGRAHFDRTLELHQRVSGGEDFAEQERIWRALASGAVTETVVGRNEPGVIHFHDQLNALLGD